MARTETILSIVALLGLLIGMVLLGTGNPSPPFLYGAGAAFAIGVLSILGLSIAGGED